MKSFLPGRPLTAGRPLREGAPSGGRTAGPPEKGPVHPSGSRGGAQATALAKEQSGVARHFICRATGAACLSPVPCFHFGWLLSQFFERRCGSLPCKGQGFHMTVQGRGRTRQERQGAARYLFSLHVNRLL